MPRDSYKDDDIPGAVPSVWHGRTHGGPRPDDVGDAGAERDDCQRQVREADEGSRTQQRAARARPRLQDQERAQSALPQGAPRAGRDGV